MPDGRSHEDRKVGAAEAVGAVLRACTFAASAHSRNRRKGAAQEPYIEHLLEVTQILSDCGGAEDVILLQAAMLHDTLEDTRVTATELVEAFGRIVADIVGEMSDDASLSKDERKRLQVEEACRLSTRARQIKVADKISNLRGLIVSPPAHWEHGRKVEYFHWAKAVIDGCRGANPSLDALFDQTFADGLAALEAQRRLAPHRR